MPGVRALDEVALHELLVERARDLGLECGVVPMQEGVAARALVGMHRVAGLVGQREHVVEQVFLEVHQDVGLGREAAVRKGARGLALVLVAIDPAAAQPPAQLRAVGIAERRERLQDNRRGFLVAVPPGHVGDQRHAHVVVVKLVEAERAAAQLVVAVQRRQPSVHGGHQVVVDRLRHGVGEERHGPRRRVVTHAGGVTVELDLPLVEHGEGCLVLLVHRVVRLIGSAAQEAIGALQVARERRMAERLRTFRRVDGAKIEVHVGQHRKGVRGDLAGLDLQREQPLFLFAQGVGFETQGLAQHDGKVRQRRVPQELCHAFVGNSVELGIEVTPGRNRLGLRHGEAGAAIARGRQSLIFGFAQGRVRAQPILEQAEIAHEAERGGESFRTLAERALERRNLLRQRPIALEILLPFSVAGVELRQIPAVAGWYVLAQARTAARAIGRVLLVAVHD